MTRCRGKALYWKRSLDPGPKSEAPYPCADPRSRGILSPPHRCHSETAPPRLSPRNAEVFSFAYKKYGQISASIPERRLISASTTPHPKPKTGLSARCFPSRIYTGQSLNSAAFALCPAFAAKAGSRSEVETAPNTLFGPINAKNAIFERLRGPREIGCFTSLIRGRHFVTVPSIRLP